VRITFTSARSLTLGVAVALVTAACSAGSGDSADGDAATIGFATPSDGATVSAPFDVELEASVPLDEPGTGNHHAHIYFDTSTDSADYDIVYGTTWQVERPLTPGEHTLIVALANPDHSLAGPTQEIQVTVDGEGGGGGGAEDAASSPIPAPTIDY
jgi:hypothetical protein